MIHDIVVSVVGNLPTEYQFFYYVIDVMVAMALICIPFIPLIAIFRPLLGGRR